MRRTAVVAVALLALSACASNEAPQPVTAPSTAPSSASAASKTPSASKLPTKGPQSPPAPGKMTPPSDPQPVNVVVGRVVRGGSGPCYGVETDDGDLYAVYSTTAGELPTGTTVRIKTKPLLIRVSCGEGEHVAAMSVEIVR